MLRFGTVWNGCLENQIFQTGFNRPDNARTEPVTKLSDENRNVGYLLNVSWRKLIRIKTFKEVISIFACVETGRRRDSNIKLESRTKNNEGTLLYKAMQVGRRAMNDNS